MRREEMNQKFDRKKLYELLTKIPRGRVVTYGILAKALGNRFWARTVGNALHINPDGIKYPCYKVVNHEGKLTENYVFGGIEAQKERLEADGIEVIDYKVDLKKYAFTDFE
jgi:O-6-methylguanine DNA methyltransferase